MGNPVELKPTNYIIRPMTIAPRALSGPSIQQLQVTLTVALASGASYTIMFYVVPNARNTISSSTRVGVAMARYTFSQVQEIKRTVASIPPPK